METNLPTIAGFISTALFTLGTLPMLTKAFHTKNLASYSLGAVRHVSADENWKKITAR